MATTPTPTTPLLAPAYRWATIAMASLVFLFAFEAMAVTTIMPTVSTDLGGRSWYSATFSMTLAASVVGMVSAGLWADRRGPRAPMVASAVVFGVGLLAAGIAPGIEVFVAARFLQGLGGGAMTVALYVLVARIYDPIDHPRIFGAFAAAWVIPSMVGPTVSGAVAETVGWRWVFLGVVGLAAAATAILGPALRDVEDRPEPSPVASGRRLALAVVVAVALVSVDLAGRADGVAAYPLAAGALLVLLLAARPLLPPRTLLAGRGLASVVGLRGLISAAFFATEIYVPYLLQEHYGVAVWLSGVALTVGALGWAGASQVQARLGTRLANAVALRAGALLLVAGIGVVLATAALELTPWLVGVAWVLAGSGMGLMYPRIGILVLESSSEDQQGANTAAMWIADAAGGATAVSVTGLVFAGVGTAAELAPFMAVFVMTSALAAGAALLARRSAVG